MSPSPDIIEDSEELAVNKQVRRVATRGKATRGSVYPTLLAERLYRHVDWLSEDFFGGDLPDVVLSFETRNRKTLGHYVVGRNGLGLRWNVNLNLRQAHRSLDQVVHTLLHELLHVWQYARANPGKPPYHNDEFRQRADDFGIPTDAGGHYLPPPEGGRFHLYCQRRQVPWSQERAARSPQELAAFKAELLDGDAADPTAWEDRPVERSTTGAAGLGTEEAEPEVVGPGSKLQKWSCSCGVNVRVAVRDFDATCNRCQTLFKPAPPRARPTARVS